MLIEATEVKKELTSEEKQQEIIKSCTREFLEKLLNIGEPVIQKGIIISLHRQLSNVYRERIEQIDKQLEYAKSEMSIFID